MTTLREAAQNALEAICSAKLCEFNSMSSRREMVRLMDEAITALKAALAQQAEPVEPVAWSGYNLDWMVEAFSRVIEAHYQRANPFQNPVHMDAQMALRILRGFIPAMKAYTAPPQRKPLTDEEIVRIAREAGLGWDEKYHWYVGSESLVRFARLIHTRGQA